MAGAEEHRAVLVGRIRRPWGRHGEMLLDVLTDWPEERFATGGALEVLFPDGRRATAVVEGFAERAKGTMIRFRGVGSIDAAEALRGAELLAVRGAGEEEAGGGDAAGAEDEWHHADLLGARVEFEDGRPVGRVREIVEGGASDLVEVELDDGGEALVPLVAEICTGFDARGRVLTIDPPLGLIDPDEAEVAEPEER